MQELAIEEKYTMLLLLCFRQELSSIVKVLTSTTGGYFIWQSNDPYENAGNTGCVITPPTYDISLRNNHKNNFIAWGAHLGFRYFIFKNVGLNGQASLGNVRWFKVGVSIKI